jgi:HAE1 family hydrophobic/amphiphilic exporter-1
VFTLYSENKSFDQKFLQNYLNINILPQMKRVTGVGDAQVFGAQDYAMRVWLKPDIMASYGLVPDDVSAALAEQNIEAAPGKFGENGGQAFQYVMKYRGRLRQATEFDDIIIRSVGGGQVLRLKDVARIELGALSYASTTSTTGYPSTSVAISQTAGSNAHQLIQDCEQILAEQSKNFPPGVKYSTFLNANDFLDASIEKVLHTLAEAFGLVFIIVFLFLQDWRSTLIPAIAVPVAIIGTFFFLNLFGFTINLLTLFALVLAIGIVVDDAIVVVEAVHAKLDQGAPSAKQATQHAMSEISGAIISITLVMAAVFVPVTFISGSAGVFYKQFGLTLAVAIVISAVNALTLSPALCALLLKPHPAGAHAATGFLPRFYAGFNTAFTAMTGKYRRSVTFLLRRQWLALGSIVVFALALYGLLRITPTGFVPNEDGGNIYGDIMLPPAASLERTSALADSVARLVRAVPEVESCVRLAGQDLISGAGSSYSALFIRLKPWSERTRPGQDVQAIVGQLFGRTAGVRGATIIFFAAPTLQGFGNSNGFEFQLQDRTGGDVGHFGQAIGKFMGALNQRPEIQYAATPFNTNFPQYEVEVNVARCKEAGVTVNAVLGTLQGYYGGLYASNFNQFGKQYRVMVQADTSYRATPAGLSRIMLRGVNGTMAPVSTFVTLRKVYGPEFLNRFNLFSAAAVTGVPKPGYSSGDAIRAIREVAAQTLPKGYGYEFSGLTREELASGGQLVLIFLLCLVFVYFLLSAQYESYILPFAVLLSLPFGLAGAYGFAWALGVDNNIFLQISLVMLIGLLAKNAILIVEFAVLRRQAGQTLARAAVGGAVARLRPILMTSFAFIFGLLPLMLASGAGAYSNRSIGTGAVGGMLVGTLFGVFVVPVLFVLFQGLQERVSGPHLPRVAAAHVPLPAPSSIAA